ncbi:MAG: helix-turn-helix transcriptional regulator [Gemmatimonadota bacterium]
MVEPISKTQRWLDLIGYLVGRRFPVPVEELMERIPAYAAPWKSGDETARASARRTFERDKDEIRAYGIPLETIRYRDSWGEEIHGYRLSRRDFYLPYLRLVAESRAGAGREGGPAPPVGDRVARRGEEAPLTPEEAGLALNALSRASELPDFPLAREARSAFRKLAFDLDPERFRDAPVLYISEPPSETRARVLQRLSDALLARKRVAFRYHGIYRDETTDRDVAPYGLLFQYGHWYLIGHDALRDDVRIFRTTRMEKVSVNRSAPHAHDYEIPADFRVADYVSRDAWELGGPDETPVEARLRFDFPLSLWAERNEQGRAVKEGEDGSAVREFEVRQVDPFLRWVLSLEGEARVLEPPELREAFHELARRVATLYEGEAESRKAVDRGIEEGVPEDRIPPDAHG